MKRGRPLTQRAPLRRGDPPVRRTPLRRSADMRRRTPAPPPPDPLRGDGNGRAAIASTGSKRRGAASAAQREKIAGAACIVCLQTRGLTPGHLAPRSMGGCDDPDCVVPMCWMHHRAYDTGRLDLLAHLEPRWRAEIAHAVAHLGLVSAYRRLTAGRWPHQLAPADLSEPA
jgi:hypothetical protein